MLKLGETWYRIVNLTKKETITYTESEDIETFGGDAWDYVLCHELQDLLSSTLPQLMAFLMAEGSWRGDDVRVAEDEMGEYDSFTNITDRALSDYKERGTWFKLERGNVEVIPATKADGKSGYLGLGDVSK
jgi:hypothetical protein